MLKVKSPQKSLQQQIESLSEFEIARYSKYAKAFIPLYLNDKKSAEEYVRGLGLRQEEYPLLKYFNKLELNLRG